MGGGKRHLKKHNEKNVRHTAVAATAGTPTPGAPPHLPPPTPPSSRTAGFGLSCCCSGILKGAFAGDDESESEGGAVAGLSGGGEAPPPAVASSKLLPNPLLLLPLPLKPLPLLPPPLGDVATSFSATTYPDCLNLPLDSAASAEVAAACRLGKTMKSHMPTTSTGYSAARRRRLAPGPRPGRPNSAGRTLARIASLRIAIPANPRAPAAPRYPASLKAASAEAESGAMTPSLDRSIAHAPAIPM